VYELTRRWRQTDGAEGIPAVSFGRNVRIPTANLFRLGMIDVDGHDDEPGAAGDAA
jgi:hypothetical protein